jgi:hypothetical protein
MSFRIFCVVANATLVAVGVAPVVELVVAGLLGGTIDVGVGCGFGAGGVAVGGVTGVGAGTGAGGVTCGISPGSSSMSIETVEIQTAGSPTPFAESMVTETGKPVAPTGVVRISTWIRRLPPESTSRRIWLKGISVEPADAAIATYESSLIVNSNEWREPPYTYGVKPETVFGAQELPPAGRTCAVCTETSAAEAYVGATATAKKIRRANTDSANTDGIRTMLLMARTLV